MAKQNILVGASANDKTGDTLRNAFVKANANFTELYTLTGGTEADLRELAQDYAAPLFNHASHVNITATYDDANNKILLTGAAAQVQSNWTASSGLGVILNKPTLFSGSYTDLTNKPTIPAAQIQSDWTQSSNVALDFIKNKPTLFSGSYTDLTNKPTIPTSFSSLVNGAYTASLGSTGILTLSNGAIATTVDNNATVNTSATVTTNNSYTNTTDFSTDVDLGGGIGVIAGWYQRNSEQIEFALFGPSAFQTYLTGLALGRTVIVTYSTSGGNQTLTRTLTQAFTATGQFDPANPTWGRVSGRIDATLPAGQTGIVSINFPVYSTSSKTWTFGTNGNLTAPGNLQVNGGKIILNTGGNAYVESVDYGVNSANSAVNIFGGPYQKIKLRAGFGTQATWTLGTDGSLTLPNAAVIGQASDIEITAASTSYTNSLAIWEGVRASFQAQADGLGITSTGWPFIAWNATGTTAAGFLSQLSTAMAIQNSAPSSPPTPLIFQPAISAAAYYEIRDALAIVRDSYAIWQALLTSVKITSGSESVTLMSNGKLIVPNIIQTDPEENLVIRTRYAVVTSPPGIGTYSNKDFTFGTNGSLTFPDTTVQSTAYVNRITNTSTTNTTMLTVNTNVVNRDRLSIRAVSPTAGSINVEFRYIGINGANVTISANNGTNIFGYSTTGAAIGWQQFNPVVFEHVGDKAEMVISDHSYHKVYRVTAMMRDTPTQYQLGSVYCIIEELM